MKAALKKENEIVKKQILSKKFRDPLLCESFLHEITSHTLQFINKIGKYAKENGFWSLCDQLIRASTSVSANIAEGRGRASYPFMISFMSIARGSLFEVFEHLRFIKVFFIEQSFCEEIENLQEKWGKCLELFEKNWEELLNESLNFLEFNEKFNEKSNEKSHKTTSCESHNASLEKQQCCKSSKDFEMIINI